MPRLHPLQKPLDRLCTEYLTDAYLLYDVVQLRNASMVEARLAAGNAKGSGRPEGGHNKSLNRAVVAAAVGALEAFCEDLVLTAKEHDPSAKTPSSWFPIQGTKGMVQTPNAQSIAKLLWVYYRYDPRPDWDFVVGCSPAELGKTSKSGKLSNWRTRTARHTGEKDAAAFALNTMVKARHGFAHQDTDNGPNACPGVVAITPTGKLSLQSHHAYNSISLVIQLAIQTTQGLTGHLPHDFTSTFRWSRAMTENGWEDYLGGTPAWEQVLEDWRDAPRPTV